MRPPSQHDDPDEAAIYAHETLHGLTAAESTVTSAIDILGSLKKRNPSSDIDELLHHMEQIQFEVQSLGFDAINLLTHRVPETMAGVRAPEVVRMSPWRVLQEMLGPYEWRARERGIELRVEEGPSGEVVPPLRLDIHAMRRAFHNVLANAIKYSFAPGLNSDRFIRIWCRRHDADGWTWIMRFQNYGIGIDIEELSLVFEPGYRGIQAVKQNTLGTGLGLWAVKQVMADHAGKVSLECKALHRDIYITTVGLVFSAKGALVERG